MINKFYALLFIINFGFMKHNKKRKFNINSKIIIIKNVNYLDNNLMLGENK
mgnify:CR=1 FL=1